MDGYSLSRIYFDWAFENPDKVSPGHTAIYFFAIEQCNRLGWKEKFGFPSQMAMDVSGIKKYQTYQRYFTDLVEWGFIKVVQKSTNQYTANVISLPCAMPENGKALDKAIINHDTFAMPENGKANIKANEKQTKSTGQSNWVPNGSIIKQETINDNPETSNKKQSLSQSGKAAAKKNKEEKPARDFWQSFIDTFFAFYEKEFKRKYKFQKRQWADFGELYDFLKAEFLAKGFVWEEDYFLAEWEEFLILANSFDWLHNHFSITNILNQYNQIKNGKEAERKQPAYQNARDKQNQQSNDFYRQFAKIAPDANG